MKLVYSYQEKINIVSNMVLYLIVLSKSHCKNTILKEVESFLEEIYNFSSLILIEEIINKICQTPSPAGEADLRTDDTIERS